jgi:O-antigen/teichoic acid export membrane protein
MGQIRKSVVANALGFCVTVVDRIATVFVLSHYSSGSILNSWLVLRTISGYLISTDLGVSNHAGNRVAKLSIRKKFRNATSTISNAKLVISFFSLSVLLASLLWTYYIGAKWFSQLSGISAITSGLAILVIVGHALSIGHTQLTNALYRSINRDHVGMLATHVVRMIELVLFLLGVVTFDNIFIGVTALLASRLVGNFVLSRALYHEHPWFKPRIRALRAKTLLGDLRTSTSYLAFPVASSLVQNVPIALVSSSSGIVLGATFAAMTTLTRMSNQVGLIFSRSIWASLTRSEYKTSNQENGFEFWRILDLAFGITIFANVAIFLAMLTFGELTFMTWTNHRLTFNNSIFQVLLVCALFNSITQVLLTAFLARSRHATVSKVSTAIYLNTLAIQLLIVNQQYADPSISMALCILTAELLVLIYLSRMIAKERCISIAKLYLSAIKSATALLRTKFPNAS